MPETDPGTNSGLPPKISLKPKGDNALQPNHTDTGTPSQLDTPKPREPEPLVSKHLSPASLAVNPDEKAAPETPASGSAPKTLTPRPVAPTLRKPVVTLRKPGEPLAARPLGPRPISLAKPADKQNTTHTEGMADPVVQPIAPSAEEPRSPAPVEAQGQNLPATPTPEAAPSAEDTTPSADTPPESVTDSTPAAVKRPVLRPAGSVTPSSVRKPIPIGIPQDAPDPLAVPGTKKSTSRITLPNDADKQMTGQIKTIKIAPRPTATQIATPAPDDGDSDASSAPASSADPKRQTSRISLESVLSGQTGGSNAPATIKIKRASSDRLAQSEIKTLVRSPGATGEAGADAGDTASTEEAKPESQKKTLKVRRPSVTGADRPAVAAGNPMFTPPVAARTTSSERPPHLAFSLTAIAATLVTGVLIYVMTAQVLDPDLAEPPPPPTEPGLPWPGRINPQTRLPR